MIFGSADLFILADKRGNELNENDEAVINFFKTMSMNPDQLLTLADGRTMTNVKEFMGLVQGRLSKI